MDSDDDDYIGEEFYESTLKSVGSNSNNNNKGGSGTDSRPKVETVADAARYFRQHKQSPFDVSEDRTVASAQLRSLDDRLDKVFAEIRERLARRKLYLEFARTPSVAAAKVTTALLRDRGIATANISGRNPDEIRKSSFYKSHSPYMNRTVKAYLSVPMEKRRHKN